MSTKQQARSISDLQKALSYLCSQRQEALSKMNRARNGHEYNAAKKELDRIDDDIEVLEAQLQISNGQSH